MAYQPKDLSFDARWNDEMEMTDVAIHVMGDDDDTELRLADIDGLPDYFEDADAENFFMVEPTVDTVKADMLAAGFTYIALTGHEEG